MTTTKSFITSLLPWTAPSPSSTSGGDDGLKAVLDLVEKGEDGYWPIRARLGWFREFLRLYAQHLGGLEGVLERDVFGGFKRDGTEGRAEGIVKGLWGAAMGAEE